METRHSETPLFLLYGIALLLGTALGFFNPLFSVLLEIRQQSPAFIGSNASLFFLSMVIGAPVIAGLIQKIGIRLAVMMGAFLVALLVPWFLAVEARWWWGIMRLALGFGMACCLIGGQAALNLVATEQERTIINARYGLAFGVGLGVGAVVWPYFYQIAEFIALCVGSCFMVIALWLARGLPTARCPLSLPSLPLIRKLFIPLQAAFTYGLAETTVFVLFPVFIARQGIPVEESGIALCVFVVGGLISTLPMALLADRWGGKPTLMGCAGLGMVATTMMGYGAHNQSVLWIWGFVAGGSIAPIFVVALAMLARQVGPKELPVGAALFTAAFSFGSCIGPWVSGATMQVLGTVHMFSFVLLMLGTLVLVMICSGTAMIGKASIASPRPKVS